MVSRPWKLWSNVNNVCIDLKSVAGKDAVKKRRSCVLVGHDSL